jgi:hypothetical protein
MARVKSTSRPIAIDSQLEVADAPPPLPTLSEVVEVVPS